MAIYTVGISQLEWREVEGGQLPSPRAELKAAMIDNIIFVTGGSDSSPPYKLPTILRWDPSTEHWETAANLTMARFRHAAVAIPSSIIESECSAKP